MTLDELERKLIGWRAARALDQNSTPEAQMKCYEEEREEFKDAIGDMIVCLINARAMGFDQRVTNRYIDEAIHAADSISVWVGDCIDIAWNEIEHRVGLTRSTGKFTKWKDLTHEERLKVSESGQLIRAPQHIVDDCKLLCTNEEWVEIEAIEDANFNR